MIKDGEAWAQETFGSCELGDERRTKRLVKIGSQMAKQVGNSLAKCCEGDNASLLGGYRFIRNEHVEAEAIGEGGFDATRRQLPEGQTVLALEDTTTISYEHAVASTLGLTGTQKDAKRRGYLVHSVLLVEAVSEKTVGLIDQRHWLREEVQHGKKHQRRQRAYAEKESYKWETASRRVAKRLGSEMGRTLSICDRESDLYEYLSYKLAHKQRFVVRAKVDRQIADQEQRLFEVMEQEGQAKMCYRVTIPQRGGRKKRDAKVVVRSMQLQLLPPTESKLDAASLLVNGVIVTEVDAPEGVEPLYWALLTTEPIETAEQVREVVRYYELRWRIEDYHKAWKSGVGVERQRFQSADNLARMLMITAFLAVRLLQLREFMDTAPGVPEPACDIVLSEEEWKVLWISTQKSAPPATVPSARWAYLAIARLGGFTDTKHTGRPGWDALWHGWFRLQERLEGFQLSKLNCEM